MAQTTTQSETHYAVIKRPSSNYQPHWDYEFFETLKNEYADETYVKEAAVLRDYARTLLHNLCMENASIASLEFIEDMQRLGLGYIFKEDIRRVLKFLVQNNVENKIQAEGSLYATALYFRLFRQHGFNVSQDMFNIFKDSQGCFNKHLGQDIKGILSLFEASYLAVEGDLLNEAKALARALPSDFKQDTHPDFSDQVTRALGLPLHRNIARLEARWYMDAYSKRKDANITLLKYAKLDFNMLQGKYKEELFILSRWWSCLGLKEKLPFTRDCLVQGFSWAIGMNDESQHSYCRQGLTKILCLLAVMDDVYDGYATIEEAQLFTDAFDSWDINQVEKLPEYMKLLFLAIYNTINEFAYDAMKKHGVNILPYLRKKFMDNIKAYMVELKWVKTGYVPTFQEYMEVACASSTVAVIYLYAYVFMYPDISTDTLDYMDSYPDIIHWANFILRLIDDLGTYRDERDKGDNVKAIQCYMNDKGVTEEAARFHLYNLVEETWMKLNTEVLVNSSLPQAITMLILSTNRTTHVFYQHGDGFGHPGHEMKERFSALIFNSVPM